MGPKLYTLKHEMPKCKEPIGMVEEGFLIKEKKIVKRNSNKEYLEIKMKLKN